MLNVEVYSKMLRKKSKAVPEGNGPVPQDACAMLGGIIVVELRRVMSEALDKAFDKHFEQKPENLEEIKTSDQRSVSLEQDARQPRLDMEVDVTTVKKIRKRTEGAAAADRAKHIRDSSSANHVDPD